jgi:hypothetical protein
MGSSGVGGDGVKSDERTHGLATCRAVFALGQDQHRADTAASRSRGMPAAQLMSVSDLGHWIISAVQPSRTQ